MYSTHCSLDSAKLGTDRAPEATLIAGEYIATALNRPIPAINNDLPGRGTIPKLLRAQSGPYQV